MAEIAFSAIRRRYGSAVRPRPWYREFRKLVLTAAVYNLERSISSDRYRIQQGKAIQSLCPLKRLISGIGIKISVRITFYA